MSAPFHVEFGEDDLGQPIRRAHSVQAVHGKPIVDGDKKLDRASARGLLKQRRDNARNTLLLAERNGFGCRGHAAAPL